MLLDEGRAEVGETRLRLGVALGHLSVEKVKHRGPSDQIGSSVSMLLSTVSHAAYINLHATVAVASVLSQLDQFFDRAHGRLACRARPVLH